MRIAVVGPGAIGATFALALQDAGHPPLLCARTPVDEVVVERADGSAATLDGPLLTEPEQLDGPCDWLLLAVKAHQTEDAAPWLRAGCAAGTRVLVLQNGIDHVERVGPLAAPGRVVPTVVWCPAELRAPGRVRILGEVRLSVPGDADGRAFAALAAGGSARVEPLSDFATDAWHKLALNAVAGLMALAGRSAWIFQREDVGELALALAAECLRVGRAEGADLPDAKAAEILAFLRSWPPDQGTSMLADRLADRPLEWDVRNGVVRRLGARHGIPTPVSDALVPLLAAASERPPAGP